MEKKSVENSVKASRLYLEPFEKFKYFKIPVVCLFASIMAFTNGFQEFHAFGLDDTLSKVGLILLVISLISFKLKYNRLELIVVDMPVKDFRHQILTIAVERKWKIELNDNHAMIFKTIPIRGYHEYDYHNKNEGERIYILIDYNKIYVKSIDNLDNHVIKIGKGENSAHEKVIINTIKLDSNSALQKVREFN